MPFEITSDIMLRASEINRFDEHREFKKGFNGQFVGSIGEIHFKDYSDKLKKTYVHSNTKDYDFLCGNLKIEVKSFKINSVPNDKGFVSIGEVSKHQKCDYYIFFYINIKDKISYLLGWISKLDFFSIATYHKEGDKTRLGTEYFTNDYSIGIDKLNKL